MGKMPVLDEAAMKKRRAMFEDTPTDLKDAPSPQLTTIHSFAMPAAVTSSSAVSNNNNSNNSPSLLDLDDIFGGSSGGVGSSTTLPMQPVGSFFVPQQQQSQSVDLLSDIFSSNTISPVFPSSLPTTSTSYHQPINIPQQPHQNGNEIVVKAYDKAGLQVSN